MKAQLDAKKRFSRRVSDYVKWRPSYPDSAVELFFDGLGLSSASTVADVGSGAGMMSKLLAGRVAKLFAVEPNKEMREAAEKDLSGLRGFISVDASAEATTLPASSIDLIVCAQSFHWFDREAAKAEFARILKPEGLAVLVWNTRLSDTPFTAEYESALQEFCPEYKEVDHRKLRDADFSAFFSSSGFQRKTFPYCQHLSFKGLLGRSVSSSYVPMPGEPAFEAFEARLRELYDKFSVNGLVDMPYRTELTWGRP